MQTHECTCMYAQCAVNRLLGNRRSTWLPVVVIFHFIQQHVSADKMAVTMKTPMAVPAAEWLLCFCILLLCEHCYGFLG